MKVTGKMQLEKLYVAIKLGRTRTVQSIGGGGGVLVGVFLVGKLEERKPLLKHGLFKREK